MIDVREMYELVNSLIKNYYDCTNRWISILGFLGLFSDVPPLLYLLFELQVISLTIKVFHLRNSGIEDLLNNKKFLSITFDVKYEVHIYSVLN